MNPAARTLSERRHARLRRVRAARTLAGLVILSAAACRRDGAALGGTGGAPAAGGAGGGGGGGLAGGADGAGSAVGSDAGGDGSAADAGDPAGDGGDGTIDAGPPMMALRAAALPTGRLIGVALGASHLSDAAYAATAAREFDFVTPENEMKWDATEPSQNTFTFSGGDAIAAFAQQSGMQVKGHTLVWHQQLPDWVTNLGDATDLHDAMINHITKVVSHFRGQVIAWDVVNEAVADNGQGLRDSVFSQYLGAGYIDDAFNAARAADPGALLIYNDYGAEGMSAKSQYVYDMVQGMLARGIPIGGVGLQMHTGPADMSPSATEVSANMQRLEALGLNVFVSEMDVQLCAGGDLDAQSSRFHDIVADCLSQPLCLAVTVWGVTDEYSWLNGVTCATPQPLLFDDNYVPKPAHAGLLNALLGI